MSEKIRDTVIEEIHQTREQIAKKFGGNIAAILEDARKRQEASGRPVWSGASTKDDRREQRPDDSAGA